MEVGRNQAAMTNAYQAQQTNDAKGTSSSKREDAVKEARKAVKSAGVTQSKEYGNVIGEPKLSEKAASYYEELKSKYGDMNFVLVANDSTEGAEQKAAMMPNSNKTVVLIDAEKIEKMAEDEEYRNKYEGIISNAQKELPELAKKLSGMQSVQGFGMRIDDDGKASFFVVSKKNNDAINEKMAQKRADKKEQAKKDAKKAEKKKTEEKLAKKLEERRAKSSELKEDDEDDAVSGIKRHDKSRNDTWNPDDYEVFEADSIDELIRMVEDHEYNFRSNNVMTEQESYIGGMVDFSL